MVTLCLSTVDNAASSVQKFPKPRRYSDCSIPITAAEWVPKYNPMSNKSKPTHGFDLLYKPFIYRNIQEIAKTLMACYAISSVICL